MSANLIWYKQGPFSNAPDPHRIYAPSQLPQTSADFYNISPTGSLSPAVQNMPGSYPFGPIFPNAAAYYPSVPGKTDLVFGYRPFS
jgi:hypothetical protein